MNRFKRWTLGVVSRIDTVVARVENHEALVTEALRELQQATARARVQLKRVQEDGRRLRERLTETREAATQWRERARRTADDEQRALECLRRSKRSERAVAELERRVEEHERVESQLVKDVQALEGRLRTLKDQRNLMRTRESRAEALGVVRGTDVQLGSELEEIFDRWETRVTETEYAGGVSLEDLDNFEEDFMDAEETEQLKAELDELRRSDDD